MEMAETVESLKHKKNQKSFTDAVKEKYIGSEDWPGRAGGLIIDIVIRGKPKCRKENAELAHLRNVVLDNCNITCAGIPSSGLHTLCPNVLDLDLSGNRLECWSDVLAILSELPYLKYVNLSRNSLRNKEHTLEKWTRPFPCLENVVLNNTGITWNDVNALLRHLPVLQELHLCHNGYEEIHLETRLCGCEGLQCLRLNENQFRNWEEIWKLHQLKSLKNLILSGNPLASVFYSPPLFEHTGSESQAIASSLLLDVLSNVLLTEHALDSACDSKPDQKNFLEESRPENTVKGSQILCDNEADNVINSKNCDNVPNSQTNVEPIVHSNDEHLQCSKTQTNDNFMQAAGIVDGAESGTATSDDSEPLGCTRKDDNYPHQLPFQNLETLCLSSTCLSSWKDLDALTKFPNIKHLRLKGIPLVNNLNQDERRKLYLACLPTLKTLNGSEITCNEREKAERHFIRHFSDKDIQPERVKDLESQHGKLKTIVTLDLTKGLQEWAQVSFIFDGHPIHQAPICLKEPIGKLRTYVRNQLGLSRKAFTMYHFTSGEGHEEQDIQELFLDSLPLSRFDILDGDEIHIELRERVKHTVTIRR